MCARGVAVDGVTCCSLINAMDKAAAWQLAEKVFSCMCISADLSLLCTPEPLSTACMPSETRALLGRLDQCLTPDSAPAPAQQDIDSVYEADLLAQFAHVQLSPDKV